MPSARAAADSEPVRSMPSSSPIFPGPMEQVPEKSRRMCACGLPMGYIPLEIAKIQMKNTCLLAGLLLSLFVATVHAAERVVTVFAASSLTDAMDEIGKAYTADTKVPVRFSYAASSALARQIESGAPAEAFVSA